MISVVIITKNEEENIGRCIRSVLELSNDIIVIDSGSEDRTVDIAKSMGAKVFIEEWRGFSEQKNRGFELATHEWVLFLDADEEVSPELLRELRDRVGKEPHDCYMVNRQTYYMGKFLKHGWFPEWRMRVFKKGRGGFITEGHDRGICEGSVGKLKGVLYHYSFKNLQEHILKSLRYARMVAEDMHRKGEKPSVFNLIFNPLWHFLKVFLLKKGFLEGYRGLVISVVGAFYTFLKYSFLFELHLKERYGEELWKRERGY